MKRVLSVLVVLVAAGAGFWYVWHALSKPAEGTVQETPLSPAQSESAARSRKELAGKNFTLSHEEGYEARPVEKNEAYLEQYNLNKKSEVTLGGSKTIAVSVRAGTGLASDSAYKLRANRPDTYLESKRTVNAGEAILFASKEQERREVTAFLSQGGRVAIISLSSAIGTLEEVENEFADILASFAWR